VSNAHNSALGSLASPSVSAEMFTHQYSTNSALKNWLSPIVNNQQDLDMLMTVLPDAESAKRYRMSFWIDTQLSQGAMKAFVIEKEESGEIKALVGKASMSLPSVTRKWQDCEKVKRVARSPFTRCHDRSEPRGLTDGELAQVANHLSNALRSNPHIGSALVAAESSMMR